MRTKLVIVAALIALPVFFSFNSSSGDGDYDTGINTYAASFSEDIESILYHPEVVRTDLPMNTVRASRKHNRNTTHFIVHIRRNQLHGVWESFFPNGVPCDSGSFNKNIPDGEWKTFYPSGQVKSVRNYSAELFRLVQNDLSRNHPKDQRFTITRLSQQKVDVDQFLRPQWPVSEPASRVNLIDRIEMNTSEQRQFYLAPFNSCLHHGVFINYFQNGQVKDSGTYSNGLKSDIWKESATDGTYGIGFYREGHKSGDWKYFDASGKLKYVDHYRRNGQRISTHRFDEN